jgi:hypothetical protein
MTTTATHLDNAYRQMHDEFGPSLFASLNVDEFGETAEIVNHYLHRGLMAVVTYNTRTTESVTEFKPVPRSLS